MKNLIITFGCIIGLFLLVVFINEFSIFGLRFWGVRYEDARRQKFEQTQSYVQGKIQDLIDYHHQWKNSKSDDDKLTIENTIRLSFSDFDEDKYVKDPELREFLKDIKRN